MGRTFCFNDQAHNTWGDKTRKFWSFEYRFNLSWEDYKKRNYQPDVALVHMIRNWKGQKYNGVSRAHRCCKIYKFELEDEFHFLLMNSYLLMTWQKSYIYILFLSIHISILVFPTEHICMFNKLHKKLKKNW